MSCSSSALTNCQHLRYHRSCCPESSWLGAKGAFERDVQIFESLAAAAYGYLDISVHTVRCYIRRSYEKLQIHSRTEAVAKFRGH